MAIFKYKARNAAGDIVSGRVEAPTMHLAEEALEDKNLEIVVLTEKEEKWKIPLAIQRVKARDLVIFSRQLSTLASANVPLVQSLQTLVEQTANIELKKALTDIASDVEAGTRFSVALAKFPKIFDNFFVSMVKSGETAGRLSEVLNYLADQTEKEYDLVSKVRSAMMYPAFIIFGMVIVGIVMLIFVIPQLTQVLIETGAELPLTTRMLIGASAFTKKFWWLILLALGGGVFGFRATLKNTRFRKAFDKFKLRIPVLGSLLQRIYLARIARTLQILLSGGVDVVGSLEVIEEVVGNAYYEDLIRETKREVSDGNSITTLFKQSPLVPPMVSQMMAIGEETGQMVEILEKLTSFYTREVDNAVDTLVSIIEPLLMVVIGVAVGMVVASIILPMYRLAGQF